jgi:hypothetical protein
VESFRPQHGASEEVGRMLEAPLRSLSYLLTAGLEAVQAICWVLAFIHRYYPVCAGVSGGGPL